MNVARGASPRSASLEYVSSAAATIFGPSKKGLWTMFSVYFDESGTHRADSQVMVLAGLVATPRQWERLTTEWQRILDSEGLSDFHMKDCTWGKKKFAGWTHERKDGLMRRLVPLIKRRVLYRTWTAIYLADYRRIVPKDSREELPYTLAAMGCCSRLSVVGTSKDLRMPCVFDQGHEGELFFQAVKRCAVDEVGSAYKIGMLSQGKRAECPPLQAADLHAYEVRKYFEDQSRRKNRRIRESFRQLLSIPEAGGGGYLLTGGKLHRLLNTFMLRGEEQRGKPIDIPLDHLSIERQVHLEPGAEFLVLDPQIRP